MIIEEESVVDEAEKEKKDKATLGAKMKRFWAAIDNRLDDGSRQPLPGQLDDGTTGWSPRVGMASAVWFRSLRSTSSCSGLCMP